MGDFDLAVREGRADGNVTYAVVVDLRRGAGAGKPPMRAAGAIGGAVDEDPRRYRTMLVLTRKLMERLYIGEDVCVTVVRLEGGQVRLGIEAPRHVPVVRAELIPTRAEAPAAPTARAPEHVVPPRPAGIRIPRTASPGIGIRRREPSR